jgi:hypothetical protein
VVNCNQGLEFARKSGIASAMHLEVALATRLTVGLGNKIKAKKSLGEPADVVVGL